jgi:hypothetical protein
MWNEPGMTMNLKRNVTGIEVTVGIVAALLLAALIVPAFIPMSRPGGNIDKGVSNARQIITSLRIYSSDHDGKYPDAFLVNPRNSNEVFRVLFRDNSSDDEMIFGCPMSLFVPDGDIGDDKERSKALEAGENHWAMTLGIDDQASGSIPLVYENPVVATWSPKWNPDAKGTKTRGRAWFSGIIVGMNDGSVDIQPLESKTGTAVPLKELGEGRNLFTQHGTDWTILNVEAAPGAK